MLVFNKKQRDSEASLLNQKDAREVKVTYGAVDRIPYSKEKNMFGKQNANDTSAGPRPLKDLYRYATASDKALIALGALASIINGVGLPLMSIIFGGLTNTFIIAEKAMENENASMVNFSILSLHTSTGALVGREPILVRETNNHTNEVDVGTFSKNVVTYATYFAYMGVFVCIIAYIQTACWLISCERQIHKIRKQFFKSILRQEIAWFDENQSGQLTTQLYDNLDRMKEGIGDKLGLLLQNSASVVAGFVIAFVYCWKLTLVMMALMPLMAAVTAAATRLTTRSAKSEQAKYAIAGAIAEEVLSCIRTVIAFNGQKQDCQRYEKALEEARRMGIVKALYTSISLCVIVIVTFSSYGLAFWYGATLISTGELDAGTVFIVLMVVMNGTNSLGNTSPHIAVLASAKGAAASIFEIIDAKPRINPYSTDGMKLEKTQGRIEFRKVGFAYPTRKNVAVLNETSLSVEPGQCLAIVGSSGCGKSTVINLLLRYYDADSGEILMDGVNIKKLNLHWLRNAIAVVNQEPVLFDATVEENIRFGRSDVSPRELVEAAKMANAHNFICSLPEGYRTRVGERGTQLSGGQKQRIAIARALVRRPAILLLDEATSALDAESESLVQEALEKAKRGRTTIVIAHRLSTVRKADQIIALKDGRVKETGSHEQLMNAKGLYYDLVTRQTFDVFPSQDNEKIETDQLNSDTTNVPQFSRTRSRSNSYRRTLSGYTSEREQEGPPARKISRTLGKPIDLDRDRLQQDAQEEQVQQSTILAIMKENGPEWWAIGLGLLGATIRGVAFPVFSLVYSQMFAVYSKEGEELLQKSFNCAMILVAIGIAMGFGNFLSAYFFGISSENLAMRLRLKAFTNVLRQDAAYFDSSTHSSGKICTRLASDAPMIKGALDTRLGTVLTSAISMIAAIAIGYIYGWKLTLLMLLIVPLYALGTTIHLKLRSNYESQDAVLLEEAGQTASEAVESIRTVQALTREIPVYEAFCGFLEKPYRVALRNTQIQAVTYAFSQCIIYFFYAICFRFGGYLVTTGDMKPLDVFKVFFVIMFCGLTISWITAYFPEMFKARVAAGLVMKMMNERPIIDNYSSGGLRKEFKGSVTFDNVCFSYPLRPDAPILRSMSLHVPAGKTIALVGSSGCGKSTVVNILERFYDPVDGRILIDDDDLRNFNVRYVREQLALVSQEPTLFDCSIAENISYGLNGVSHARIVEAAKLANIYDFIVGLPEGYKTRVGEKGIQLSGGQKQRIAIARALVRNPKILLLDEATSALDTENEKIVQEALDRAREGRTCIIVAHRLSTIQNADQIALLRNGCIIEQGSTISVTLPLHNAVRNGHYLLCFGILFNYISLEVEAKYLITLRNIFGADGQSRSLLRINEKSALKSDATDYYFIH